MSDDAPRFRITVPPGDERARRVCDTCGFIDYVNPRLVAGVVAVDPDGRVLMCKRAIDPRRGFWTLPAGFMEEGESVEDAARREAREEACAELQLDALMAVYSVPRISQVQMFFAARLTGPVAAGPESEAVALYDWDAIPWDDLAFPTVRWALDDWRQGRAEPRSWPALRSGPPPLEPDA